MIDQYGRIIDYLRISITERCDMRCVYCMPPEGLPKVPREDVLSFEEIERLVRVAASVGFWKVRITGGEPLVRRGIVDLVGRIAAVPGVRRLAMTTNAMKLAPLAGKLRRAGVTHLNISLDSLDPEKFRRITRNGDLKKVLAGIEAAEQARYERIKINVVLIGGLNVDEVPDLVRLTLDRRIEVRFLEIMPFEAARYRELGHYAPVDEAIERAREVGELETIQPDGGASDPAFRYRVKGAKGTIGFIAPMSRPFCRQCSRLRITSTGVLRACLLRGGEVPLRDLMRAGADDAELIQLFEKAANLKPAEHGFSPEDVGVRGSAMIQIGG